MLYAASPFRVRPRFAFSGILGLGKPIRYYAGEVMEVPTMAKRIVYEVVPDHGDWRVERRGADRASGVFENKADAVARARELAQKQPVSQVVVKGEKGRVQTEWTYRKDPYPPKG
jgi:hypothetical protein